MSLGTKGRLRRQFALLLGQKNQLWWTSARESLELTPGLRHPERLVRAHRGEMTELLAVKDKLNVMVRELSLGERMKMELIASLLHSRNSILDERPSASTLFRKRPCANFSAITTRRADDHRAHQPLHGGHPGTLPRVIIIDQGRISSTAARECSIASPISRSYHSCDGGGRCRGELRNTASGRTQRGGDQLKVSATRDSGCKALLDELRSATSIFRSPHRGHHPADFRR